MQLDQDIFQPIRLYGGKVRLYHGTTLKNFNSILKSTKLGLIDKGLKKISLKTYATKYPALAEQYANERAKLSKERFGIILSFIVDCDSEASSDYVIVANQPYRITEILTDEKGEFVFSEPIDLSFIKVHNIFYCS